MKTRLILCAIFAASAIGVVAEEGFWPFNMVPREELEKKFGLKINDGWLDKVRMASLRFNNGGSGSFVSPRGLVMTNQHVASDIVQKLSTNENDMIKTGFLAKTLAEELKAPDLELNQLIAIDDVTARVKGAAKPGATPSAASSAMAAEIAAIEKESLDKTGLRSDVVTLYRGAEYHLYRYKKFTDVRLVFAPEMAIGFFGGDADNFTFPRFDLDVAFFRVYENGKPYETVNWFSWSKTGAKAGDVSIVSGNPGGTRRLNAVADLEFSRDVSLPLELKWMKRGIDSLKAYAATGAEQARTSQEEIFGLENSYKDLTGQFEGLKNENVMARKREAEAVFLKNCDPAKAPDLIAAYMTIAKSRESYKGFMKELKLIEEGFYSELLGNAWRLVRLAEEMTKPDGQRLGEYTEARLESLRMQLFAPSPISADFEKMKLTTSLTILLEELGPDHPAVRLALDGKKPLVRAAELVSGTKMADPAARKKIADGGRKAIQASTDPMIVLARLLDPLARGLLKRLRVEVEDVEMRAYDTIATVWKESAGVRRYPDGTFTPRLSFGVIKGYEDKGKWLEPFTTLEGLYERSAQYGNKDDYELPKNWLDKMGALDLKTPLNFVSTNDIIGGNSGSPVLNADAEIIGLIFDGNIYSLIGDFLYDETMNRAVAVDGRAIIEALTKVYGAGELVKELSK